MKFRITAVPARHRAGSSCKSAFIRPAAVKKNDRRPYFLLGAAAAAGLACIALGRKKNS